MDDHSIPIVILCGGRGTRMGEATQLLPKPLQLIGNRPMLWHVMKIYGSQGFANFVLATGWLGEEIKRYFLHYHALTSDFTIELGKPDRIEYLSSLDEGNWRVTCVDTGIDAMTGARVRRASEHLAGGPIMVTYGDGLGPVDIPKLLAFHRDHGRLATVTSVRPPGRFGELIIDQDGMITEFAEKPQTSAGTINGGFMVFEKEAIERYIPAGDESIMLEREPMNDLAHDGQLMAFEHDGFFQPMDTQRERQLLEDLWKTGNAPWKTW
jgi:glucose-1-phosphate cytidylyltransferase